MSMHPIPGQPGLFRQERRTALSEYTWSVPTGRPWVIGDLATTQALLLEVSSDYDKIKRAAQPLIARYTFSPESYAQLARRVVTASPSSIVTLDMAALAQICRGVLSSVARSVAIAQGLLTSPYASAQDRAKQILLKAARTITSFRAFLIGANTLGRGARASGLGVALGDDAVLILAGLAAGTLVCVITISLAYAVMADAQANEDAIAEAERACALDAAAGRPCGGAEYQAALNRAREAQNEWGFMPNLNDLFKQGGALLFWGGLLVVGAALGYAAWTAEPARRNVQERLRRSTAPGPRASWYNLPGERVSGLSGARAPKGTPRRSTSR